MTKSKTLVAKFPVVGVHKKGDQFSPKLEGSYCSSVDSVLQSGEYSSEYSWSNDRSEKSRKSLASLASSKSRDGWSEMSSCHKRAAAFIILLVIFCGSIFISCLAPFFPEQAMRKGLSTTDYSLVISVFSLVMFINSPIYGKYMTVIGTKFMFTSCTFITGVSTILFGLLEYSDSRSEFLGVSYAVRIAGAFGDTGVQVAAYAILPRMFPDNVASMSGAVESSFALGYLAGPPIGGILYELGGFGLPFYFFGALTCFLGIFVVLILPNSDYNEDDDSEHPPASVILEFLRLPFFWLTACVQLVAAISNGFINDVLEPHMLEFYLSESEKGLVFAVNGLMYLLVATFIGRIADKYGGQRYICLVGVGLVTLSYMLLGPAPFVPLQKSLWLVMLGLGIHGAGWACELVGSISGMIVEVVDSSAPGSLGKVGLVSGLFNAVFNLGCFLGPAMAGPLYTMAGFRWASMSVFIPHVLVEIGLITMLLCEKKGRSRNRTKDKEDSVLSPREHTISYGSA